MSVTIDATGTGGPSSNTITAWNSGAGGGPFTFTVGASANTLVIAVMFTQHAGGTTSGVTVTWNGTSMTSLVTNPANGGDIFLFGLRNPSTGTFQPSISWTGANQAECMLASFIGADTTSDATAFTGRTTNTGSASPSSLAITNASGNIAFAGHVVTANFSTASGTDIGHINTGTLNSSAGNYDTSVNPTLTYTFSSGNTWSSVGCSISAPSAGRGLFLPANLVTGAGGSFFANPVTRHPEQFEDCQLPGQKLRFTRREGDALYLPRELVA